MNWGWGSTPTNPTLKRCRLRYCLYIFTRLLCFCKEDDYIGLTVYLLQLDETYDYSDHYKRR